MSVCPDLRPSVVSDEFPEVPATFPSNASLSKRPARHPCIDDLSDDLLVEILLLLCESSRIHYQPRLAAVCRRWRELVMHTPLFWTRIRVPSSKKYDTLPFFERSKPALIDLTFCGDGDYPNFKKMERIYTTVAQHASRLRTFHIQIWNLSGLVPIFDKWANLETPHLQNISISITSPTMEIPEYLAILPAPDSNQLEVSPWPGLATLHKLTFTGRSVSHFLPAPNLNFLEVSYMNADIKHFQDVFNKYPLLETLVIRELRSFTIRFTSPNIQVPVHAPSLRSIAIYNDDIHNDDCECALSYLFMDNLEYLEVGGFCNLFRGRHTTMFSQSKGMQSLKKVRINSDFELQMGDISLLSSLSNSVVLEVLSSSISEEVLLAILNLKNFASITLTIRREIILNRFSRLVYREKPKLGGPLLLRLVTVDKEINSKVAEILGSNFQVLKFRGKPGLLDASGYLRSDESDEDCDEAGEIYDDDDSDDDNDDDENREDKDDDDEDDEDQDDDHNSESPDSGDSDDPDYM